ncbi:unnamed protein product [Thlaspi arvense]|uniref:Tyrosine-protein kinase catalytic domain-containing protein n=1 Tax=Thlaspi arvense TaxID=13288 RepID=A0AAU9T789_THLAR|nr:unnamed protein product [Thlaspi arvense]
MFQLLAMVCFRLTGKSSKRLETKNNEFAKNKIVVDGNCDRKNVIRDSQPHSSSVSPCGDVNKDITTKEDQLALDAKDSNVEYEVSGKKAQTFTFEELSVSTGNIRSDCFLGEGGFEKVYKSFIDKLDEAVAIKQHDRNGAQAIREFVVELLTLSLADHENLVKLIGFCAQGVQRLLVYEYMPLRSLENYLYETACVEHSDEDSSWCSERFGISPQYNAAKANALKDKAAEVKKNAKPEADDVEEDESDSDGMSVDEDDSDDKTILRKKRRRHLRIKKRANEAAPKRHVSAKKAKDEVTPKKTEDKKKGHTATPHPTKKGGKTPATATPVSCGSCKKSDSLSIFNSENALESHNKAKDSAAK